ncbi:MAG: hypothetical protein Q9221_005802 [Calogaya cf. arnoldii]
MDASQSRSLPPEIWRETFLELHKPSELAHLWVWGRLVSRQFCSEIEDLFASHWLKETSIVFDCGAYYEPLPKEHALYDDTLPDDENIGVFSLEDTAFDFKCFAGSATCGETQAIFELGKFTYEETTPTIVDYMSSMMYRHGDRTWWPQEFYTGPRHYVLIEDELNDTELPGLEWNKDRIEISLNWKKMFNKYFREEDAYQRSVQAAAKIYQLDGRDQKLYEIIEAGLADAGFEKAVRFLVDAHDNSRKTTRRERIRRQLPLADWFTAWDRGNLIDRSEKSALKKLKDMCAAMRWDNGEGAFKHHEVESDESEHKSMTLEQLLEEDWPGRNRDSDEESDSTGDAA